MTTVESRPVGLSAVRLAGIEGTLLAVEVLDILDGSLLLDIKAGVPEFDDRVEIRQGWLEAAERREVEADDRFTADSTDRPVPVYPSR